MARVARSGFEVDEKEAHASVRRAGSLWQSMNARLDVPPTGSPIVMHEPGSADG